MAYDYSQAIKSLTDRLNGTAAEIEQVKQTERDREAQQAASRRQFAAAINEYIDRAKVTGDFTPKLVEAYTKGDQVEYLRLADSILKNSLYGVSKSGTGFIFYGSGCKRLTDIKAVLESKLGYSGLSGNLWISRLLQAAFTAEVMGTPDFARIIAQSDEPDIDDSKMSFEDRMTLNTILGGQFL